jgi:hypothetical protein
MTLDEILGQGLSAYQTITAPKPVTQQAVMPAPAPAAMPQKWLPWIVVGVLVLIGGAFFAFRKGKGK